MKKFRLIIVFFFFTTFLFSQTKSITKCHSEITCSQKYGTTVNEREYELKVIFDNKEIKFTTYTNTSEKGMNTYYITKKTAKYVIASNNEGNYSFYNINKKQFYNIDYYLNRYLTAGYGTNTNEIKQNTEKMIEILKNGNTQKDAIQYLINQTEYDF